MIICLFISCNMDWTHMWASDSHLTDRVGQLRVGRKQLCCRKRQITYIPLLYLLLPSVEGIYKYIKKCYLLQHILRIKLNLLQLLSNHIITFKHAYKSKKTLNYSIINYSYLQLRPWSKECWITAPSFLQSLCFLETLLLLH